MKSRLIIVISLYAFSLSGQAAARSLESCAAIENPVERLACYDTLAGRLPDDTAKDSDTVPSVVDPVTPKAAAIVPATPSVAPTAPPVEPKPDTEAIFGLEHKQKPEKKRTDELQLKWTRKKKDAYGKWIIAMENGQVWRQTDSGRFIFKNPEQRVIVSRGFAGTFFLKEPESNKRIRVERVK